MSIARKNPHAPLDILNLLPSRRHLIWNTTINSNLHQQLLVINKAAEEALEGRKVYEAKQAKTVHIYPAMGILTDGQQALKAKEAKMDTIIHKLLAKLKELQCIPPISSIPVTSLALVVAQPFFSSVLLMVLPLFQKKSKRVDAAHAIAYEQAKVELESLFEAKWHNPNTTNVLDKDEDKDKVVVKVKHTPWQYDHHDCEAVAILLWAGHPVDTWFGHSFPKFEQLRESGIWQRAANALQGRIFMLSVPNCPNIPIIPEMRHMMDPNQTPEPGFCACMYILCWDLLETPLMQEEEEAGQIKDSCDWGWKAVHAGVLLIQFTECTHASCPATPAEFDGILHQFTLLVRIISTHPGLVLCPLIGQTVNGFFEPK
ncbi:hypothetical protein B0H14DRAFT_2658350 [Mycena olivaceomarginata]|nr:hypothetical protein B0H14DRAFT_2658350 [Mycena olivaceomarginata]